MKVFPISAISRQGLQDLLFAIADMLEVAPEFPLEDLVAEETETSVMYKHEAKEDDFTISRDDDGAFVLSGGYSRKFI